MYSVFAWVSFLRGRVILPQVDSLCALCMCVCVCICLSVCPSVCMCACWCVLFCFFYYLDFSSVLHFNYQEARHEFTCFPVMNKIKENCQNKTSCCVFIYLLVTVMTTSAKEATERHPVVE